MRLAQWLTQTPTNRPIAWVNGQIKTEIDFFADVGCWMNAFRAYPHRQAVIFTNDTYRFATQLFGAWQADVVTILPADLTETTIERLARITSLFVTDESLNRTGLVNLTEPVTLTEAPRFKALDPNAPLVEMFTSGSTGVPTRIIKHLRQLFEDIEHLDAHFSDVAPAEALVWSSVPHQHIYGFLWRLLWPLASGRIITSERLLYPETIRERLALFEKNVFVTSPAHLKRLPPDFAWGTVRDRLQMITSSGGPLFDDGLRNAYRTFGQTPFEIFGSTELDGVAWRRRQFLDDELKEIDATSSRWHPMPGVTVKADHEGLLWIRSPRLESLDWTAGSDLIEIDPEGTFVLQKRVDRIAKIEEKRVSLDALESEIKASGLICEVRAFQTQRFGNEKLVAICVPSPLGQARLASEGKRALVKALRQHLNKTFESLVLPHRWRFEPQLPTDERGKHSLAILERSFDERSPQLVDWTLEPQAMTLTLNVSAQTPHFEGHFPELAVLPGITQLHWVIDLAHRYLGSPVSVAEVKNLKFQALLLPKTLARLHAQFDAVKMQLTFEIRDAQNETVRYSSGKVCYRA
ncbi:MAG: acyl-CoA synthetase [Burkholderiaceae bacterium]|nr:acyl-CoA synthetase [Burkholderiaceae bacterium]